MIGKTFKKVLYFLGIEDEMPQERDEIGQKSYTSRSEQKTLGRVINIHQASKNKMIIFKPRSFEEVRGITDEVKNRRAVIVNFERTDKDNAKRILDFLSGSVYALNGSVKRIGPGIFLFVPDNIDVANAEVEENRYKPSLISKQEV